MILGKVPADRMPMRRAAACCALTMRGTLAKAPTATAPMNVRRSTE
jgi:hypothetical protein